jgi:5-methylthioadenosine/S-adenosylhomocysteine deaminase
MTTTLIKAGIVVTLNAQDDIFAPGFLLVQDDRIVEIGPLEGLKACQFDQIIDLSNRLVMPGLVNAHTHTPMVLFRGMAENHSLFTFEGWYAGIRVLEAVMDAEMVPPAVLVSCAEMIRTGTTCFADQYFYMDKVLPAVRQSGLRAALAYGIVEMGDAAARQRELEHAAAFLESAQGDARLQGWVGPHAFFVDNSSEAIRLELALADRFSTGLHFHLGTSGEEERYCRANYGCSAVEQMERMGILERRLLAAHAITVPESDFPALARYPFTAVVAPSACMRSGAEIAPACAMRQAGINLAIGTDNVANNNSYDLFKEMQLVGKLMALREKRPNVLKAREILEMATLGGARALGLEQQIGDLSVGKKADWIGLDLDEPGWGPAGGQELYTALVYAINGNYVREVMVDGSWLMRDGRLLTVDWKSASRELDSANAELRRRLGA